MPKVWAFDVDERLDCSNGPIPVSALLELREQGHITGLCGNLNKFCTSVPEWWKYVSFLLNFDTWMLLKQGPCGSCFPKYVWLQLFQHVTYPGAEEYIMVGNVFDRVNSLGFKCGSRDDEAAAMAGWRFIVEDDFAAGVR